MWVLKKLSSDASFKKIVRCEFLKKTIVRCEFLKKNYRQMWILKKLSSDVSLKKKFCGSVLTDTASWNMLYSQHRQVAQIKYQK